MQVSEGYTVREGVESARLSQSFQDRWPDISRHDPFYNPNLDQTNGRFEVKL
jgi:hypothetical protein